MLSEEQIQQVLRASLVVPLTVARPLGPLGLEPLAAAVSRVNLALGPVVSQFEFLTYVSAGVAERLEC